MTKHVGTGKEFAVQLLNPLTKFDFEMHYQNGNTEIGQALGQEFAQEAAIYSASKLNGTIVNVVTVTQRLMDVLKPLNDSHFNIAFDRFASEILWYFTDPSKDSKVNASEALNAFSHVVKEIDRQLVHEFLISTNYQYSKNEESRKSSLKY